MRWTALLIPLLCFACERSILLGSECPDFDGPCPNIGAGDEEPTEDSATPRHDAAASAGDTGAPGGGGEELDAGAASDAATSPDTTGDARAGDAGARFPGIQNPSFELPPDAATPAALTTLGGQTMPWYGCRAGMSIVSEVNTPGGDVVHPTEGDTFFADGLSADFTQSGVMQDLSEPLKAGQHYALNVDVWAEQGNLKGDIGLKLGSSLLQFLREPLSCILSSFTELANKGPITPGGWRTLCMEFTPDRDISAITLLGYAAAPGNVLGLTGAQLYIDNLRPAASCP